MKAYGYGILRPFLDKMIERITITDKLFVLGIVIIFFLHLIPFGEPYPTTPSVEGFGEYAIPYEVSQDALLNKADSIKALVFISICYVLGKVSEFTGKKKEGEFHENDY